MKNNNYQVTGIKGRLLPLGFILLIVFLSACNGGYDPSAVMEETIFPVYDEDTLKLDRVIVKIPKKITHEIEHGRDEAYEVEWEPSSGMGDVTADPTSPGGSSTTITTGNNYKFTVTTIFTFQDTSTVTNITIAVYIWLPDETGAAARYGPITTKDIPTTLPTP